MGFMAMSEASQVVDLFGEITDPEDFAFERFWKIYPRKVGKGDARKKFAAALKRTSVNELMDAVTRFAAHPESVPGKSDSIPHASTWLNQERWNDSPPEPQREPGARIPPPSEPTNYGERLTAERFNAGLTAARAALRHEK